MPVVYAEDSGSTGMFSFAALYQAYLACRKRKRHTINALKFEFRLLDNLCALSEALENGIYEPCRSVCFVTGKPKLREIFSADFSDRVVHHLVIPKLEEIFEPKFIHDSYACRTSKGTHAAVKRLQTLMVRAKASLGGQPVWFLQLDVRSFFMGIDKAILIRILTRHVKDPVLLALTRKLSKQPRPEDGALINPLEGGLFFE